MISYQVNNSCDFTKLGNDNFCQNIRESITRKEISGYLNRAALRIQRWWRYMKIRKSFIQFYNTRLRAVAILKIKMRKHVRVKEINIKKINASVTVQKYMKGFIERKRIMKDLANIRIENIYQEMLPIETKMKTELQTRVRSAWL
jgi:hypothetical protein